MVALLTAIVVAMITVATGVVIMIGVVMTGAVMIGVMIGAVMIGVVMSHAVMTGMMIGIVMTGAVMIDIVMSRAVMIGVMISAAMIDTAMSHTVTRVAGAMGATALLLPSLMCAARYARFMVTPPVTAGGTMVMILMMKWITMSKRCMPLLIALTPTGTMIPVLQTTLVEL
jgi:hypothetical protein